MRSTVRQSLESRMRSYVDLLAQIDEAALLETLDITRHKTVKAHLWCIIGARQSYARALQMGRWQGFECSMNAYGRDDFAAALESSAKLVLDVMQAVSDWTPARDELLLALAEHEVMHEGQLIRHLYGVGRTPPKSWRWA